MSLVIGIDASRNRSGGARAHLVGILTEGEPRQFGIREVHLWSYRALLDQIPDFPWLIKHNPPELEKSLLHQAVWQYFALPKAALALNCDLMLNTDAGTIGRFQPSVVMSRDMLSYEKGEMERFGFSMARLRLLALKYVQARSMKKASGVIFLTNYAAKTIQEFTGKLGIISVIPHGVGKVFRQTRKNFDFDANEIKCLYVSNASMYKHQWHVVKAIGILRKKGFNLSLLLAGGGSGKAQRLLEDEITKTDPKSQFVKQIDFVKHHEIPSLLSMSDMFIFASSCENMPNTLLEAMASEIPIACSDRGPMPEVLENGGVYFNPEIPESIARAIEKILLSEKLRKSVATRAKELSNNYSWKRCGNETWAFLAQMATTNKN
jgi:glycosyltransferase involved in cell wall biosynthesis